MALWFLHLLSVYYFSCVDATVFMLHNNCKNPVWPGFHSAVGKPLLGNGGFKLKPGQKVRISVPKDWSGRLWGRSGCTFNKKGLGTCVTGDCGGLLRCTSSNSVPPATFVDFSQESTDFYDVSLIYGYNMPLSIIPKGGSGMCQPCRCVSDLNPKCPSKLRVRRKGKVVACKSACMVFGTPRYCCTFSYANSDKCKPTRYSHVFKRACPSAYSYPYDDPPIFTSCKGANYLIKFC
ncbi:pathogenesis-related thaumatin-like protein 3.5 [Tasmannia lanceolata]|uniref:pathogenesis-related thaumatin-like protein 3.5 n=1 Tax=Tasmannia lanceolata TaxID=3420 RepID=UPI0040632AC7